MQQSIESKSAVKKKKSFAYNLQHNKQNSKIAPSPLLKQVSYGEAFSSLYSNYYRIQYSLIF